MIRAIDVIMVSALLGGAAWTFHVKNQSEAAINRIAQLEHQLRREREEIDILKADWSLLTSPDRLAKLSTRYDKQLGLVAASPTDIGTIAEIPLRSLVEALPDPEVEEREASKAVDKSALTGSTQAKAVPAKAKPTKAEVTGEAIDE